MDKGIRVNVNAKFVELNVERCASTANTRNKQFRKDVMLWAMEEFEITLASAATHYNHALKLAQVQTPALVADLGRAEDKKGGRKPKSVAEVTTEVNDFVDAEFVAPETFAVKKKKDGTVVAEGLTLDDAKALCYKATQAKKAALYWV